MAIESGLDRAENVKQRKQVFISYSDSDKEFVHRLTIDLETAGLSVWIDKKKIEVGDSISRKIEEGILGSDFFLLVLSGQSIQSTRVKREYSTALSAQWSPDAVLKIFPLLIEEVQLPKQLKDVKCADFSKNYDSGFKELFDALNIEPVKKKALEAMNPPEVDVLSWDEMFLKNFRDAIEKNLSDEDFDSNSLCKKLKIGRSTLYRKIKALTGESVNQNLKSYRLERATKLIKKNYGNITDVAFAVGFSSSQYFNKCFKEKFHQTPTGFRDTLQEPEDKSRENKVKAVEKRGMKDSIGELDGALLAQGAQTVLSRRIFKDKEGTPQRDEIFEQVKELYDLYSALNEASTHFTVPELTQKIQEMIEDKKRETMRSGGYVEVYLDFYEIKENQVRKNARSVAAVCMAGDFLADHSGYSKLRLKHYGETFNLCISEPFYDQPIGAGHMCTGILVGEDVVLTAAHFAKEKNVSDLRFVFDFVMKDSITPITKVPNENIYKGIEILHRVHNPEGDWALVKLDRKVTDREIAELSKKEVFFEQPVYVIGYPCGLPLKFSPGAYVEEFTDSYFRSGLNVYSSSSGSPVFCADTHKLIGIASRSKAADFRWTGTCWLSLSYPGGNINIQGTRCTRTSEFIKHVK